MKILINLFFIINSIMTLNAQQKSSILVQVRDSATPLAYAEVWIDASSFYLTDAKGNVEISRNDLKERGNIHVKALGFETKTIAISDDILSKQAQIIQMLPTSYQIPEVEIKSEFDAQKFFNKKKKKILYSYRDKHSIILTANIFYTKENKQQQISDSLHIICKNNSTDIQSSCLNDTLLSKYILNGLRLSRYLPYSFSYPKYQKLSTFDYKGINDDNWIFLLTVRPEALTHPFYQFESTDESSTLVSVDKNGFIPKMETRTIIHSGKSNSYNLTVNYINRKGYLAPSSITMTIFFTENSHPKTNWQKYYGDKLIINMNISYL